MGKIYFIAEQIIYFIHSFLLVASYFKNELASDK
jgi:hypothetical protein